MQQQLKSFVGEKVTLYLYGGRVIDFKIDNIEEGAGLIHGRLHPSGYRGCFRVSRILGYHEE
jgi:hypothetical protein